MNIPVPALTLVAAVLLDLLIGDPVYRLHPVRLIGSLAAATERLLRRKGLDAVPGGSLLLATVLVTAAGTYVAARLAAGRIHPCCAAVLDVYVLYSCIALRDMTRHAGPIAAALRAGDLPTARQHLALIVGRDVELLDEPGVARAAIESTAENFVDGLLAPIFWFVAAGAVAGPAGLPAMPLAVGAALAYRCVNTLDSMVGYRNERYLLFGRPSARLDDLLNFIPARLSIAVLWLGAVALRMDARAGRRVALRDRLKHASPNSAHAESFVAGAIGRRLGGPTAYPHGTVEKPWLGEEGGQADADDIGRVCRLTLTSGVAGASLGTLLLGIALC